MDTEAEARGADERIALAAEAATRSSAAALLEKQQYIPVKEDYFSPADEVAAGACSAIIPLSCYLSIVLSKPPHIVWLPAADSHVMTSDVARCLLKHKVLKAPSSCFDTLSAHAQVMRH